MPAIIASCATATSSGSYLTNVTEAAQACLQQVAVPPDDLGIVINVGIYRDANMLEPSIAALIQQRIGAGLTYRPGPAPTFSFDLLNGGCGLLDACTVAESLFAAGDLRYILITAGEAHPSTRTDVDGFPYTPSGAALLLQRGETDGFSRLYTASDDSPLAPFGYLPLAEMGSAGRSTVFVDRRQPDPLPHAVAAVRACVHAEQLELADVRILAPTTDLADRLAAALPVARASVLTPPAGLGNLLSGAPAFAYTSAIAVGGGEEFLWLAADGPVASCVRYRHPIGQATNRTDGHVRN